MRNVGIAGNKGSREACFVGRGQACEDEVGGVQISTDLSPIERRVGLACAVAKWMPGGIKHYTMHEYAEMFCNAFCNVL